MNPYHHLVNEVARLAREGRSLPLGGFAPAPRPTPEPAAPTVLVFSPHPDDECIIGGLALRLLRESRCRVVNVAVTLGSNRARQAARLEELRKACEFLGFDLVTSRPSGLEHVNRKTRDQDPALWKSMAARIAEILLEYRPGIVFFPHDQDWNSTHVGVHHLLADALAQTGPGFTCYTVETEFWGQMDDPNLTVELSTADLADLVAAISFHVGEVQRNPYHLLLPAWMQDNVRRGGELVGGQGGAAPDFLFATLYRLRQWTHGRLDRFYAGGRTLPASTPPSSLFGA
ncbi:MAG TPA: PIG-L family deacetylase [Verrucomicrobiota bacterium]|nr:PIG-L family deacetylase [Verrucomicrobiota bacterium]HNU51951.1 PIG-L family deacetylase [Verrucomicrobiota bacterium]